MNCSCPTTTPVGFSCLFNLAAFTANVDGNLDTLWESVNDSNEFFSEFDLPESCLPIPILDATHPQPLNALLVNWSTTAPPIFTSPFLISPIASLN